jgi:hypothetical protein
MTENKSTAQTRQRSASYPRYNLQQVERFARVAFDIGPRHCDQDRVAQALNYKNAQNGAFIGFKASASQFGLITGRGQYLSVADEWIRVFNEEDPDLLRTARQEAMRQPELYRKLIEDFADRQFPSLEKLTRELHLNSKYGILKDASKAAAEIFVESANFASLLDTRGYLRFNGFEKEATDKSSDERQKESGREATSYRSVNRTSSQQATSDLQNERSVVSGYENVLIPEELDRIEIRMRSGQRAYLFVPVPLPLGEKERLKKYIDLILEEETQTTSHRSEEGDMVDGSTTSDERT